ncbi:hypothetical protein WA026_014253 [Henosepilachna vigintioctopunctata]|uniref:Uncharacterized protein n=1 Tax=Henosepilachna vigintioctopunctata TaxID=420089 RepID=A0AAW1TSY8_9CUCU
MAPVTTDQFPPLRLLKNKRRIQDDENPSQTHPSVKKCANCGDQHTANNVECPVYKKIIENKRSLVRKNKSVVPKYIPAPIPTTNVWETRVKSASQRQKVPDQRKITENSDHNNCGLLSFVLFFDVTNAQLDCFFNNVDAVSFLASTFIKSTIIFG